MFLALGVEVNLISLALAITANMVVGMLWYGPLFGGAWLKLVKKRQDELIMKPKDILLSLLFTSLVVIGMNSVMQFAKEVSGLSYLVNVFVTSMMVATVFTLPVLGNEVVFEGRSPKLITLNWGHQLANYLVAGLILGWFIYN